MTAVVAAVLMAAPGPAGAAEDGVVGGIDPTGVTITIVRWQGDHLVRAAGADGGGDPTGCSWAVVPAPLGVLPPADIPPWRPDSWLGLLTCDGVGVEVIWVGPYNTVDLGDVARRRVEEYVARVPVPRLTLHANPAPEGLVGLESWFWAAGWDGRPVVATVDALGFAVDVRIEATPVTWSFGDGDVEQGGLGVPYPARSPVRHVFIRHGRWPVRAALDWVPRYRIDGTDWEALPAIPVRATLTHLVREVQAVLVRPS